MLLRIFLTSIPSRYWLSKGLCAKADTEKVGGVGCRSLTPVKIVLAGVRNEPLFLAFMMDVLQPRFSGSQAIRIWVYSTQKIGFHDAETTKVYLYKVEISLCAVKMQSTVKKAPENTRILVLLDGKQEMPQENMCP